MKKLFFWTVGLCLLTVGTFAQKKEGVDTTKSTKPNFFSQVRAIKEELGDEKSEGGFKAQIEKMERTWSDRLFPSGLAASMADGIAEYVKNFNTNGTPGCTTGNWTLLGPIGVPAFGAQGDGGRGVGQIHVLKFSPTFATDNTVYAGSNWGGLWRRIGTGAWSVVGTDTQLAFSSVSDIAINPNNPQEIYVTTGEAESSLGHHSSNPNAQPSGFTPLFTAGVYRTTNGGVTWVNINGTNQALLDNFINGGTIRRILLNPNNTQQLFIATTTGIFKTDNATIANPVWTKISNATIDADKELKGFEFRPGTPNTIYASGRDIYRSIDGGATWTTITGGSTMLNLNTLPNGFIVNRINLAVTQANNSFLYAYIVGRNNPTSPTRVRTLYIYRYDGTIWTQLYTRAEGQNDGFNAITPQRTPIAVSPGNANRVYFGTTVLEGTNSSGTYVDLSDYNGNNFHADVHALAFNPSNANQLYCGTDGGIHIKDLTNNSTAGVTDISAGLAVATSYGFDDTDDRRDRIIIGNQDTGTNIYEGVTWSHIRGGDGYNGKIDGKTGLAFGAWNVDDQVFSYNFNSGSIAGEFGNTRPIEITSSVPASVGCYSFTRGHFDMINHPLNENMYFVFSELQERLKNTATGTGETSATLWRLRSDIGRPGYNPEWWQRQFMSEGDISMSNPNYILLAQSGTVVDEPNYLGGVIVINPRLYLTTNGGCNTSISCGTTTYPTTPCFSDITPALNSALTPHLTNSYSTVNSSNGATSVIPIITGVVFHPENHLKAWLTFTGYERKIKVWFTTDGGATWQNADPNGTLYNLPVNDIVYQRGSNDRIYIATDAGIYFRDNSSDNWQKYCDFPNVRVTELKINYCLGRLRAATFGRGVWEGNLLASNGTIGNAELAITSNTTWAVSRGLDRNLRIKAGSTLTIQGTTTVKTEFRMPKDGKIIIEKGAQLVLTDARITNNCGQLWGSIEVEGDPALSQTTTNQGKLKMTRSSLENARNAITTKWGGGIIEANNSQFFNNKRSVEFLNYPSSDNISYFHDCEFRLNSSYTVANGFTGHITMWNVIGVDIKTCTFANDAVGLTDRAYGLFTIDANYDVNTNSSFNGFKTGVNSTNSSTSNTVKVDQATFNNNAAGVYLGSLNNAVLTRNTMQVGNYNTSSLNFGIFIENSTGYKVEENTFTGFNQTIIPVPTGIVASNSGNAYNRLYKNTLTSLNTGIKAEADNVNESNPTVQGLEFLCNQNSSHVGYDFHVVGLSTDNNKGVKQYQGSSTSSAGNTFTASGNIYDFVNTGFYAMRYYHSSAGGSQTPNPILGITNFTASSSNTCPSMLSSMMLSNQQIGGIEASYTSNQKTVEQKKKELQVKLDGGDAPKWQEQIAKVNISTSKTLEAELDAISPWVSSEMFLAILSKKGIFSEEFIENLAKKNPSVLTNVDVVERLKQTLDDQKVKALFTSLKDINNERSTLEHEIMSASIEMEMAAKSLVTHYQATFPIQFNSLRDWLSKKGSLYDHYQIVESFLQENRPDEAVKSLKVINSKFKLTVSEQEEYLDYSDLVEVKVNAMKNERNISTLNEIEVSALVFLAEHYKGRAGVQARSILNFFYGYNYEPELQKEQKIAKESLAQTKVIGPSLSNTSQIEKSIFAYPNPANQEVTFQYQCKEEDCIKPSLVLYDLNGHLIQTFALEGNKGEVKWSTIQVKSGLYIYQFRNEKSLMAAGKISISH